MKKSLAFSLPALHEPKRVVTAESLRGRVYLLNVWASWCVACRQEHPVLKAIAQQKVVPLVGLNYKDKRDDALGWLKEFENPYEVSVMDADGRLGIELGKPPFEPIAAEGRDVAVVERQVLLQPMVARNEGALCRLPGSPDEFGGKELFERRIEFGNRIGFAVRRHEKTGIILFAGIAVEQILPIVQEEMPFPLLRQLSFMRAGGEPGKDGRLRAFVGLGNRREESRDRPEQEEAQKQCGKRKGSDPKTEALSMLLSGKKLARGRDFSRWRHSGI